MLVAIAPAVCLNAVATLQVVNGGIISLSNHCASKIVLPKTIAMQEEEYGNFDQLLGIMVT